MIILLPCSCRRTNESKRSDFLRFEQLMPSNPDSVLSSLQTIDPEQLSRGEQAWYYLLKTEAEDKLYRDHTTDSLIAFARDYYASTGDIPRLAKAFYLSGRIHTDWKEWERATEEFLKAKELTEESEDWGLKGRIEEYLGYVNRLNDLPEKALSYYKKAYSYYLQGGDKANIAYALRGIGIVYWSLGEKDSTFATLDKALTIAEGTNDGDLKADLYRRLSFLYTKEGWYEDAYEYTCKAIANSKGNGSIYYSSLCEIFLCANKIDSLYVYAQKILSSNPDLSNQCLANYYLSEWAERTGRLKESILYKEKYEVLSDSIDVKKKTESVGDIQKEYEQNELKEEYSIEILLHKVRFGVVVLFAIAFICYLIVKLKKIIQNNEDKENDINRLSQVIDENQNQISILKSKADLSAQQEALIERLKTENRDILVRINEMNINRCKHHAFLKKYYNKYSKCNQFTEVSWHSFLDSFDEIYPNFVQRLEQANPEMTKVQLQICVLSIMGVKTKQIGDLLGFETTTVSTYKQKIKKQFFKAEAKCTLEEYLLKYII